MGLRGFKFFFSLLLAVSMEASALPRASRPQSSVGQLVEVAIGENDNRGALEDRAQELGLTSHDEDHIRKAIGLIHCPGTVNTNGAAAGAVIAGAVILGADDQLIANRHALIDVKGKIRDPLSKCYFENSAINPKTGKLDRRFLRLKDGQKGIDEAIKAGLLAIGSLKPTDGNRDTAVVKMKSAIPGAKAYQLPPPNLPLHGCDGTTNCMTVVAVSGYMKQMPRPMIDGELVAQSCPLMNVYYITGGRGSVAFTDCSATPGASGSVNFLKDEAGNFLRDNEGELVPFAIFQGSEFADKDYQHYYLGKPDDERNKFTKSLILDNTAAQDVKDIAASGAATIQDSSK